MHCVCEIVIPPPPLSCAPEERSEHIVRSVGCVMERFCREDSPDAFCDFYVIGGRFAGNKLLASCDPQKLEAFYSWMETESITVSSFIAGKEHLDPPSQQAKVDAKWNELFPSDPPVACPIFAHSNYPFAAGIASALPGDVMPVADVSPAHTCRRMILAAPSYNNETQDHDGPLAAIFTLKHGGVSGHPTWDGTLLGALELYRQSCTQPVAKQTPTAEWLTVTVDYHF